MSERWRYLLSPYRLPSNHPVYLNDEEMGTWLNGYTVLWHPALLWDCTQPPRIESAYDHDFPKAANAYVLPESPPQFLSDHWEQRVLDAGSIKLVTTLDRNETIAAMKEAFRHAAQDGPGRDHFGAQEQLDLLNLPDDRCRPYFALGFGYLMIDSLFEAMDHEKLIDIAGFMADIQAALKAELTPDSPEGSQPHLRAAAEKLKAAREILYSVTIYLLDVWRFDESSINHPPAAIRYGSPLNIMAPGRTWEQAAETHPEFVAQVRAAVDESQGSPVIELIGGIYREREDALLPFESQLWNLRTGRSRTKQATGANVEVLARAKSADHPHTPAWVQSAGLRRSLILSLDGSVTPNLRSAMVNWSAPDGKSIDTLTRVPLYAHKNETYFNLVYSLHQSISSDSSPTFMLMHHHHTDHPLYEDWLTLHQLCPVLGEFVTTTRYFSEAMAGEYIGVSNADDFFPEYLQERINEHRPDAVSAFALFARARRKLDAAHTLATIHRSLSSEWTDDERQAWAHLNHLEHERESKGVDGIPELTPTEFAPEADWAKRLTDKLQARATDGQPGFMVLNPCSFTRRIALELPGITGNLPIEGPLKAAQFDADMARLVVEVPPFGFSWIPAKGSAQAPKQRVKMAEGNIVRNEYIEAEIDPGTGGIRSVRDVRLKMPRLGMVLAYNPGSRSEARSVKITQNGPALGEITSEGVILNEQHEELASFKMRVRTWLTRPILDVRIELTPKHLPVGYPWHAYYGARFAWRDERAAIMRGVNGLSLRSDHSRPCSPDFVEIKIGRESNTILTGGLPFLQKHSARMLDLILMPEGEETRVFDFAIALDRELPMQAAHGYVTPPIVVPTTKGGTHIGPSGWLFQLDAPNLTVSNLRLNNDTQRTFTATMIETTGLHAGSAELTCLRAPNYACFVDGDGNSQGGLHFEGETIRMEFSAAELFRLRAEYE